jgi:type IV pilus assembly protein PilY1
MTTITLNPSASNHDASQDGSGVVTLTGELKATAGTHWIGLLLPGVTVPVGATINSATLYYKPYSTARDDPGFNWYAEAADNASVFTTTGSSISSRSRTTAVTGDTATNIGTGSYRTVDVTAQVDEVTTRAGWASGNNIVLIADASAAADIWINSYDTGRVRLVCRDRLHGGPVHAHGGSQWRRRRGINRRLYDAATTTMDTDSVGDIMGFMFRGVQVPTGSSITTAYLKVYTNDSGRDSPNVTIKAQYNPAAFSTSSSNFSGRTLTTASASWVATDIGIGAYKNSPSLTSVLQEVVDNGGWTGAGDVAFFLIQNSSSGWLRVASWDHATDPPPQLYVEWSDAPSPISGAGDVTLGAVTGSAAAVLPGHGAAASTLGAVTTSGAAALTTHGAGAATLGAVTGTAAGVLPIKGTAGAAVDSFSLDIAAGGDDGRRVDGLRGLNWSARRWAFCLPGTSAVCCFGG